MPQLFPMNWIMLTSMLLLSTIFISICIFFLKMNLCKNQELILNKFNSIQMNW
uniref:ATP synthase F0 subunit 8 n=1 Tax=Amblyomma ovale TaxID=208206 RepID=A0A7D5FY22_9ACAR|nr:ATP synthase F0 subunit 8 [Amblyomma ovale]